MYWLHLDAQGRMQYNLSQPIKWEIHLLANYICLLSQHCIGEKMRTLYLFGNGFDIIGGNL